MRRNVILVTVDSLRADHCGFMGYERDTTPTLDRWADQGFFFENAIAPGPSTYESMPAIFSGRDMVSFDRLDSKEDTETAISLDYRGRSIRGNMHRETIPEWFSRMGYTTGAFTPNPYTAQHTSFGRGFDYYEDFLGDGGEGPLMRSAARLPVFSELKHMVTLIRGDRATMPWTDYYDDVVSFVREADEPYFLWVFLLDSHTPYLVNDEYRTATSRTGMWYQNWKLWMAKKWGHGRLGIEESLDRTVLTDLYDDTIRFVDKFLAELWRDLGGTDPVVVVHADHGEAFGEHGIYGHHSYLYRENVNVPLVVHNGVNSGTESGPFSLTTLGNLLRCVSTGRSSPGGEKLVFAKTLSGRRLAIVGRRWKYVQTIDEATSRIEREELYDTVADPLELTDLSAEYPDLLTVFRRRAKTRRRHERELHRGKTAVRNIHKRL